MSKELYTIGYEGSDINSFIANLRNHSITCLVDVRENPVSRKTGFSKAKLAERLEQENIGYIHIRRLGSPRQIRKELKGGGSFFVFINRYISYLSDQEEVLKKAYDFVIREKACLMCFEKDAEQCHRTIVAQRIKEIDGNGLKVINI